ncbi:MAG: restriction endonuclease PLD domain-containing protein [Candidatus Puniceispirillaceae bacterium]
MLTSELFNKVLIEPSEKLDVNKLQIVSGFATPTMVRDHLLRLRNTINIELIIGMVPQHGIEKSHHYQLVNLSREGTSFLCRYVANSKPVHSKTYLWSKDGTPTYALTGSANYTSRAFSEAQIETMGEIDPTLASDFISEIRGRSIDCHSLSKNHEYIVDSTKNIENYPSQAKGIVSLLTTGGVIPNRSGINWGQRAGRDSDQAYLAISKKLREDNFFPDRGTNFNVITDDGMSFSMRCAQQGGKALHTPENNALLGKYLRERLGVNSGEYVTEQHLLDYGSSDIVFTRLDDDTYFMDFRPNKQPN